MECEVLRKLVDTISSPVEAVTFSKEGEDLRSRMQKVRGRGLGGEGTDLSSQETHNPASWRRRLLRSADSSCRQKDTNGTALAYPVFSPQGEIMGGISAIVETDGLLNAVASPQHHFDSYNRSDISTSASV